jgi:hypothetical protein
MKKFLSGLKNVSIFNMQSTINEVVDFFVQNERGNVYGRTRSV